MKAKNFLVVALIMVVFSFTACEKDNDELQFDTYGTEDDLIELERDQENQKSFQLVEDDIIFIKTEDDIIYIKTEDDLIDDEDEFKKVEDDIIF